MAGQQQQIIETIFSLKRRLLRNDDSSDDEESDTPYNHRKQSLKRKVQYARAGKPEHASDPPPYKKRIEHAGYRRYILQRNPPRYDPDGDIVEPGDEYEDEDELSPIEENPYADIKLEELLAPLTSAADLPTHPGFSPAYTSKHLTNLTKEAAVISRKEQVLLARVKVLSSKLMGDPAWIPGSVPNLTYGEDLQDPWVDPAQWAKPQTANGESIQIERSEEAANGDAQGRSIGQDSVMQDVEQPNSAPDTRMENNEAANGEEPTQNGESHKEDGDSLQRNGDGPPSPPGDDASETASQQAAHRMTTRARAQAASDPSPPPSPLNDIHPLFTYPTETLPDRDLGLPAAEAEDTRLLLLHFVQKQEEIARAATDLYGGLLQGERMRQEVFSWSKAEGHIGEMSDGEDWYDKEEWGLEEDLVKGRDEEEDDTQVQGKKSTRQRRTKDKDDR